MITKESKKIQAFSLLETAIILAVITLVLGGVWIAAATLQEQLKIKRTTDGFLAMYSKANTIFDRSNIPSGNVMLSNANAIAMGIAPTDWIQSGNTIVDPWGSGLYFAFNNGYFQISVFNLSKSHCIQLINSVANNGSNKSGAVMARPLSSVINVSTSQGTQTFPVSLASSICQDTNGEIAFLFNFER